MFTFIIVNMKINQRFSLLCMYLLVGSISLCLNYFYIICQMFQNPLYRSKTRELIIP